MNGLTGQSFVMFLYDSLLWEGSRTNAAGLQVPDDEGHTYNQPGTDLPWDWDTTAGTDGKKPTGNLAQSDQKATTKALCSGKVQHKSKITPTTNLLLSKSMLASWLRIRTEPIWYEMVLDL